AAPDVIVEIGMLADEPLGGGEHATRFRRGDRFFGASCPIAATCFDLDEDEVVAVGHHEIKLAGAAMPVAGDMPIALCFKEQPRMALAYLAQGILMTFRRHRASPAPSELAQSSGDGSRRGREMHDAG